MVRVSFVVCEEMNPLTLDLYTPQLTQDVDAVATFAGELNHNEKEFIMQ
jgi:hypothetical protein